MLVEPLSLTPNSAPSSALAIALLPCNASIEAPAKVVGTGSRSRSARSATPDSKGTRAVPHQFHDGTPALTGREFDIARCVVRGQPNKIIARELGISPYTVRDYVSRLLTKFNVESRRRLAWALTPVLKDIELGKGKAS